MNDLDDLLREDGGSWQPSRVPAPDLEAALARASARRAKLNAGAAMVLVVALAAGGVTLARQFVPGIPATPDPRVTPTLPVSSPASTPSPSAPAAALIELTDAVHESAIRFGIPAQAEAVPTSWLKAQEFLPGSGEVPAIGDTAVWVVQVRGEFSCDDCQTTQNAPDRSVSTLTLVLGADGFDRLWFELGDVTRPLQQLGTVATLDPDGSTGWLSFTRAVHDNATRFGIPVTGEAVLTTWLAATEFLPSGDSGPAGDTQVWLIQVRGSFSCDDCQPTQTGPEPSVGVLTLVLDAATFESYYAEPGDVTRPLGQLGVVQAVDLAAVA
ncbi:MAG: hypothetical protein QM628_16110 [Propionicimonas sp.]